MIAWIRDQDCAVALDSRMHPVMISSWYGVATVEVVDQFYAWSDRTTAEAMAAEQRLIRIADLRRARPPSGAVRRRAFDHNRNDLVGEVAVVRIVVLDDPILRSIIHTMRRIGGGRRSSELVVVDKMSTAIELTLERLRAERIPPPQGLDPAHYEPPRWMPGLT
ncbi:MAG: hypothetical protein R6X02_13510 [Enhygromyxa sp.]